MADLLEDPPVAVVQQDAPDEIVVRDGGNRSPAVRLSTAAARARAVALLAVLLVPIVLWLGQRGYRKVRHDRAVDALFGPASPLVARPLNLRLSYSAADHPRAEMAAGGVAADAPAPASVPRWALAELERAGDRAGLVAAAVLGGELDHAAALLDTMAVTADVLSDRMVVASLRPAGAAEALAEGDRALALAPGNPRATWNRAAISADLGLSLAAAQGFEAVAASKEIGWGEAAAARAKRAKATWNDRVTAFAAATRAAESIKTGTLPPDQVLQQHPDLARLAFYAAARETNPPEVAQSLVGIAVRLDRDSKPPVLASLLGRPELLREMLSLRRAPTLESAEAYQRLAEPTRDPWLLIRGAQFLGQARTRGGDPAGAEAAYQTALTGCQANWFPQICIETKIWLAYLMNNRRRIQDAKRLATEAKKESQTWALPVLEAKANARLAVAEDLRERFALSRAFATEAALQKLDCTSANTGRELLAKISLSAGDPAEARRQLEAVTRCSPGVARFGMIGTEALAGLVADGQTKWVEGGVWLREAIAQHRKSGDATWIETMALRLFEARADLVSDHGKGQGALSALAGEAAQRARTDEAAAMVRIMSTSALVADAGARAEYAAALEHLESSQGITDRRPCTLGVALDSSRGVFVGRTRSGDVVGAHVGGSGARRSGPASVPATITEALASCEEVGVIATAPLLGQSKLLPGNRAWAYLRTGAVPEPLKSPVRRLVIYDARPPESLGLPRLPAVPSLTIEGAVTESLQGTAATPATALERAVQSDLIEWHVHGLLDPEISDAASLALSPDAEGRTLLTASDILKVELPRRPGVILGACRAGQSARYGAYQWSLPLAFLAAGARWVIASPTPVEDAEAPVFFSGIWNRIRAGATPAIALRDERRAPRWHKSFHGWIDDIVIFH